MNTRTGYLTIYSDDRTQIYGEFADALWEVEQTDGWANYVMSGTASEGTMDTFRRLNAEGIANVAYDFETAGRRYSGMAQLLAPEDTRHPGEAFIRIETGVEPALA